MMMMMMNRAAAPSEPPGCCVIRMLVLGRGTAGATGWPQIMALCELLMELSDNPCGGAGPWRRGSDRPRPAGRARPARKAGVRLADRRGPRAPHCPRIVRAHLGGGMMQDVVILANLEVGSMSPRLGELR
jgi:hypothetical protein